MVAKILRTIQPVSAPAQRGRPYLPGQSSCYQPDDNARLFPEEKIHVKSVGRKKANNTIEIFISVPPTLKNKLMKKIK